MTALDSLTKDVLQSLYCQEGLTDQEIAKRYGTYQVKVSRLRQRYGIETKVKSDRFALPSELGPRLRSILIGSMLGDGRLHAIGSQTARYEEHHSIKQRAYLDWKAQEWGPFLSGVVKADKGPHHGYKLYTHGCRHLFEFWKMFYPMGVGSKQFWGVPLGMFDALALAVWFMDDGSKTGSYVRFSVGPDQLSQAVQLQLLENQGLSGKVYQAEGEVSIHLTGRKNIGRFVDLVRPYLHPSMAYKLDLEPRKLGSAPRDILTPEVVTPLLERGFSKQKIATVLNVSRTSVGRAFQRMGLDPRQVEPIKGLYTVEEADEILRSLSVEAPNYLDTSLDILAHTEFPERVFSEDDLMRDVERLRSAPTSVQNNTVEHLSPAGTQLCGAFFDYRLDAKYRDLPSLRAGWYDREWLKKAIRFQVRTKAPVRSFRVLRALQVVLHSPTNFRPCTAYALVRALCPAEYGVVLDPCAGYGGRAAGTLAAGRSYVGVDPHPKAPSAYQRLGSFLKGNLTFYSSPFEDVDLGDLRADMVLTSPPYFFVERYADDSRQSWVRYKTWHSWVVGFLEPLVNKSFQHLKPGGLFCLNTKDIRLNHQVYPILSEVDRLASAIGLESCPTISLPMGRLGNRTISEPLLVYRKATR